LTEIKVVERAITDESGAMTLVLANARNSSRQTTMVLLFPGALGSDFRA
jgi:hypothetical protein